MHTSIGNFVQHKKLNENIKNGTCMIDSSYHFFLETILMQAVLLYCLHSISLADLTFSEVSYGVCITQNHCFFKILKIVSCTYLP
jgi:hypothetical protein